MAETTEPSAPTGEPLELCPECGKQTLLSARADQPLDVCLTCGIVGGDADATVSAEPL